MTHENYSTKNIIYYVLAGAAGLVLLTAATIVGHNIHRENLEKKVREENQRIAEYGMV